MSDPGLPWGGDIPDIPSGPDVPSPPNLTPVPDLPPELPSTPFPPIGPIFRYVVHGASAAWSDIASWVSDEWHKATSFMDDGQIAIIADVKKIVDQAINYSQTAWSTFVSALETQLIGDMQAVYGNIDDLTSSLYDNVNALWDALDHQLTLITSWALQSMQSIDSVIAGVAHDGQAALDFANASIRQWVVDDIFKPLEEDILRTAQQIYNAIDWETANLQNQLNDLNRNVLPGMAASIATLTAAQAALQKWQDECGDPMCEEYGPKTDLSKLLKDAKLLEIMSLIASLGALSDPKVVGDAALVFEKYFGPIARNLIVNWLEPLQSWTPG